MRDLPKRYDAKSIDSKWYQFWEGALFFNANPHSSKPPYCIVMPPPNVTGALHMGHALVTTLQDTLIRWKRMLGFEVLWLPGTDHAGISTQTVVERELIRTQGKKRNEYTREEFLSYVWQWKDKSETRIIQQLKHMGSSCDWSRLRFTMDEGSNRAVRVMFKKLYDEGLIYRGSYLVYWDTETQTALADDEVEYEEKQSFLWHINYPLADDSGFIQIATTRPETMLGDVAIAVAPNDPRYSSLIGKQVRLPLLNRLIPVIADRHVDPEFGTGAVKVTPAHDFNDYQIGLAHQLPMINVMTSDGRINANGECFEGLTIKEAREAIVARLKQEGHLAKIEPHVHRVGVSYRSKAIVEPYLSKQWFVRMDRFGKRLHELVSEKKIRLIPSYWENTYFHWINHLRDWCISRQLWWGHRIPIWYHRDDPERMICYDGLEEPPEVQKNPAEWHQDPDVLDTWFSSALWPFSTLGWPDQTLELNKFYPTSTLITGHDILFFWVARMIAMGEFAMGDVPFPETFLHGLIYGKSYWRHPPQGGILYVTEEERKDYDLGKPLPSDVFSKWEKMSKSKGNIIDPLEMIEQYGTDAVRMALCASATQAAQIDLDRRRFEEFKNFANKIWNGTRFVLMNLENNDSQQTLGLEAEQFSQGVDESLLALEDRWILYTLRQTVQKVNHHFAHYEFDQAAMEAYSFFWKEFCAYYVEICKPILFGKVGTSLERINKQKLLVIVLCQAIRLMHPIAPFITEEIFHILKEHLQGVKKNPSTDPYTQECCDALQSQACLIAPYPQPIDAFDLNPLDEQRFQVIEQVVYTIRNIRGEMNIALGMATDIYIIGDPHDADWQMIEDNHLIISALVRTENIFVQTHEPSLGFVCSATYRSLKVVLPMPEELIKQESLRLVKERDRLSLSIDKLRSQLANQEFIQRAPSSVIDQQQRQLSQEEKKLAEIMQKLG